MGELWAVSGFRRMALRACLTVRARLFITDFAAKNCISSVLFGKSAVLFLKFSADFH